MKVYSIHHTSGTMEVEIYSLLGLTEEMAQQILKDNDGGDLIDLKRLDK